MASRPPELYCNFLNRGDGHVMYNGCFKQAELSALDRWESAKSKEILEVTIHHQKGAR